MSRSFTAGLLLAFAVPASLPAQTHHVQGETHCPPAGCPQPMQCPPGWRPVCPPDTPSIPSETPGTVPLPGTPSATPDMPALPGQANVDNVFQPPAGESLISSLGTGASDGPSVPNMIGDAFGADPTTFFEKSFVKIDSPVPSPSSSVVGRQKIAENTSPIPRDRAFFNYNLFDNVPLINTGVNVDRLTFGVEKTFNNNRSSIEFRVPYAYTLDSDIVVGDPNKDSSEFGNINLALKHILHQQSDACSSFLISGGLAVTLPTADDLRFFDAASGTQFLNVENEAVHLLPFLAALYRNQSGLYVQGFAQVDWDTNGNQVNAFNGIGQQRVGTFDDATFLFASIGVGYYMQADEYADFLTAIAPTVELHYNRSLDSSDRIAANGLTIDGGHDFELMNAILGMTLEVKRHTTVQLGYGFSAFGRDDQQFDGEFRLSVNRFFGGNGNSRNAGFFAR